MASRVALITGVGPGTGAALARRFSAGGYSVAMLARTRARLDSLEKEISGSRGFVCDVSDRSSIEQAVGQVQQDLGAPSVVIHNAVGGAFAGFQQLDPGVLRANFETNVMGLLHLAQLVAPAMIEAKSGAIVVTGNTSAFRGRPLFAGFAPTKAAQRILAESIARDLGPQGVHVAYVTIDAVIDLGWTRQMNPDAPDEFFIKPAAIADEVWHVAHQDRSSWSFNVEIRPFCEKW